MQANLADLFELAVDTFPDREYLVATGPSTEEAGVRARRTFAEVEDRANRLAHYLQAQGVEPGDHVGIYAYNCAEWIEALWAIFKIRAVWININYRYVAEELRYLVGNADLVGLIHGPEFADRLAEIEEDLAGLRFRLCLGDQYEAALAAHSPERDFAPRSADDIYILYTGGTTGMPKGVVWRHEDVFYALGGGINPVTNERVADPGELARKAAESGFAMTSLPIAPLMHGASQWSVMSSGFQGNRVVLMSHFEPARVWELVQEEKVNLLFITGDAMARPLIEALDAPGADYDTSSLFALASTAAIFSPSVKDQFLERLPNLIISDAIGSSETGANGHVQVRRGNTAMKGGPTVNAVRDTVVVDDDLNELAPGSGQIGKVARKGNIPLGYYKDPVKTAETFREKDGVRYAIPGDYALLEEDGTITLLGRGSVSINSGGEKIYPEEVEAAVKSHPAVWDATVIGVPDERWGQRVAAVVALREGADLTLEELQEHCRHYIAGYKVPRQVTVVPEVVRSPSGKPDYRWAKDAAVTPEPGAAPPTSR